MDKDDLRFLGRLFAAYFFVMSLCLAYICTKQRDDILDLKEHVQKLEQKNCELEKVHRSSVELISELASKSR